MASRPAGRCCWSGTTGRTWPRASAARRTRPVLHTVDEVTAALAGLRVLRAEQVRRPVQVDGEQRVAIDTLVRAVR